MIIGVEKLSIAEKMCKVWLICKQPRNHSVHMQLKEWICTYYHVFLKQFLILESKLLEMKRRITNKWGRCFPKKKKKE